MALVTFDPAPARPSPVPSGPIRREADPMTLSVDVPPPALVKHVFDFTEGRREMIDLLGGNGAGLAEMGRLGLPVPVNAAFESAGASGPMAGRLRYTTDPIVLSDVIGDPVSCVFDSSLTQASGRLVKVFGWYDNERLVDLTRLVATGGAT
jgi:hypothetical protein